MQYCTFLEHYRRYTEGNETPESVHLWSGLSAIAGASERRLWVDRSLFKIYLNLYLMFLAPAGVCKKSTAMGLSQRMLEEVGAKIFEGVITKAKIVSDLMDAVQTGENDYTHASITYIGDELNELIAFGGGEMIKFLTSVFNSPKRHLHRTITSTCVDIPNPWLNLSGNVVPQWFSLNLANDMSATGLLSRFIIVSETDKRGCMPNPRITDEQKAFGKRASEILFWIYQQNGEVRVSDEAEAFYDEWYRKNHKAEVSSDFRYAEYYERKLTLHVIKVAALMALGDCRTEILVIDFQRALHLLDKTDRKLKLFYSVSGTNKYALYITRIINILDNYGGQFPLRKIAMMLSSNLTGEEIASIIKQLNLMGVAKIETIKGTSYLKRLTEDDKHEIGEL